MVNWVRFAFLGMGKPAGRQRYPDWVRFVEIGGGGTLGVLRLGSFRIIQAIGMRQ